MKKHILLIIAIFSIGAANAFAQDAVRTISGGVVNGKALSLPAPAYPAAAAAVGASGAVNVQVLIDEDGNVVRASAASGHPLLRAAAEKAARRARFRPTMLQGKPVKVSGVITYVFNLSGSNQADEAGTAGDIPSNVSSAITDEKAKLDYLTLGAFIRMMVRMNADENLEYLSQTLLSGFSKNLESDNFPEEFKFIAEIATAPKERRAEILSAFNSTLRKTAASNQTWYIEFGEDLGDLIFEAFRRNLIGGATGAQTKNALAKIKNSLGAAPPDFPRDLLRLLTEAAEFSERNNLADVDILSELDDKIIEIGDIILDENEK